MKYLLKIAFFLRLRQKFWGHWFMRWHSKQTQRFVDSLDLDISNIKFTKKD